LTHPDHQAIPLDAKLCVLHAEALNLITPAGDLRLAVSTEGPNGHGIELPL
jgi:hypothetical protein